MPCLDLVTGRNAIVRFIIVLLLTTFAIPCFDDPVIMFVVVMIDGGLILGSGLDWSRNKFNN